MDITSDDYICDHCGEPCPFEFEVDHTLWNKVVHEVDNPISDDVWSETSKYLCLLCFAEMAKGLGIEEFPVTIVGNW